MHSPTFLTIIDGINWHQLIRNYHIRHYIWEVTKVFIPVLLTGFITFVIMRVNDNKNKRRWLNDGHLRRKTELEINIRKFLLGIQGNVSDEYFTLIESEDKEPDLDIISCFNKDFETLYQYLENEEGKKGSDISNDNSVFALMNEYVCYVPKIQNLFDDFKSMCADIIELGQKKPEQFNDEVNIYLCFQDVVERILKKLTVKKIR